VTITFIRMSFLKIIQHKSKLMPNIPHRIWLNDQLVGIMQKPEVLFKLPSGTFKLTIQSMIPFIYSSTLVHVSEETVHHVIYSDREKWWDILFWIDVVLWCADFFFTLPAPYNICYQIFTNGYFVVWMAYEWWIRKRYFKIEQFDKPVPSVNLPPELTPASEEE